MGRVVRTRRACSSRSLTARLCRAAGAASPAPGFLWRPARAAAQTTVTLVSNTGQTHSDTYRKLTVDSAQSLSTGGSREGYELNGVDIHSAFDPTDLSVYSVKIAADSSDNPSTSLGTLTNSTTLSGQHSLHDFPASGNGIDLAANTAYWMVIDVDSEKQSG